MMLSLAPSPTAALAVIADPHDVLRDGSAFNANFDLDGVDDYRVDANVAIIDQGIWKPEEVPSLNLVHLTDCINPDPWHEWLGEYELPDTQNTTPDPVDPYWVPDERVEQAAEEKGLPSGPYGCLENSGEPMAEQIYTGFNVGFDLHSIYVSERAAQLDGDNGLGGVAPGARIWSVRGRAGQGGNWGQYPDLTTMPLTVVGSEGLAPVTGPDMASLTCGEETLLGDDLSDGKTFLRLYSQYEGCSEGQLHATVAMNSCRYVLTHLESSPGEGSEFGSSFQIACPDEDEIEITTYYDEKKEQLACTESIGPQAGLPGVSLANREQEGSGRKIELTAAVEGIEYERSGPCVEGPTESEQREDGELNGTSTLQATDRTSEPRGLFVDSENRISGEFDWLPEMGTMHAVAAIHWATATREDEDPSNDIDVAGIWGGCGDKSHPVIEESEDAVNQSCDRALYVEAIEEAVDHGVVVVVPAGAYADIAVPQNIPDTLTTGWVTDSDGRPGGEGPSCGGFDDQLMPETSFGLRVDIDSPQCGGGPSGANGKVTGALAALASQCPATDRAGAEYLVDTLLAQGDTGEIAEGGWKDDSGDGWKEPLLNLRDEEVFDPVLEDTETHELNHQPESPCPWRSHQAESDVNSDGRADLVALDGKGKAAKTFAGAYEGPAEDPAKDGYEVNDATTSLEGQLDPALHDGKGDYMIDTADVDGDRHADLVTVGSEGDEYVHPGEGDGSFGEGIKALGTNAPAMNGGLHEPIAVADVTGDGRADLVYEAYSSNRVVTAPGQANGTFGTPSIGPEVDSALTDGKGSYFLDAIDVTGEELDDPEAEEVDYFARHSYADLVTIDTNGTVYVYPGQADGKFGSPVEAAKVDPILDNGKGEEPIGLGDVDRDRRADLLTLSGQTLKLYRGQADGSFAEPTEPYAGDVDSSLTDGRGEELIGLLDYSRDGLADLVSLNEDGEILTYTAQRDKTFAPPHVQGGEFTSARASASGTEFVAERPLLRRAGCAPEGCGPGPIAAYSFEEGSGSTLHDSAGDHDGTIEGASWTTAGKYGSALDFDGVNDLVKVADANDLDLTGSFTLEAWVEPDTLPVWGTVLAKHTTGGKSGYQLGFSNTGKPGGMFSDAAGNHGVYGSETLGTKKWSHLALTADGANLRVYLNGTLIKEKTETVAAGTNEAGLQIGHSELLNSYFDGRIDELRIYGRALSQAEIEADKATPIAPHLEAESFSVSLAGEGPSELQSSAGAFECTTAALSGSATERTRSLALDATYSGCTLTDKSTTYQVTVQMNGCHYTLDVANVGPPYEGAWGVACKEPSEAIEYKITASKLKCLKIPPQAGHSSVGLSNANAGAGSDRAVGLDAEVSGFKYERLSACGSGVSSDGVLDFQATLQGKGGGGGALGVWLSGAGG